MLNQNTKKSAGIEFALIDYMGEMGMDNFGCLNSSLFFFFFQTNLRKKIHRVCIVTAEPPPSPTDKSVRFWLDYPSPSERTYVMDHP